jgi:hypothetical protein
MHPVPVQRSIIRSSGGSSGTSRSSRTKCIIEAAVSCLPAFLAAVHSRPLFLSYRGISTPGLHCISKSPKNSVPKMYCSGLPDALSLTSCLKYEPLASMSPRARRAFARLSACSRSHRSSARAACRSRQGGRRAGNSGSMACALRRSAVGMRGMAMAWGACWCW